MNILPRVFIALNVLLYAKETTENILLKNTPSEGNDWKQLIKWLSQNDTNSTIIYDANTTGRDKRALGIFLQGLVQALGYNSTPIQLATLPNPNTTGTINARPINFDIRSNNLPTSSPKPPGTSAVSMPTAESPPKQRETLRFTGVVNFGNNSDILGHLRQYEQIFHSSTSTSSPSPQQSSTQTTPIPKPPNGPKTQRLNALLEPYFVPIPIPLSSNIENIENLKYPQKPIFSILSAALPVETPINRSIIVTNDYSNKESHREEIIDEKNQNVDERKNSNGEIVQSNKIKPEQSIETENSNESSEHDEDRRPDYNENENNETLSELQTNESSEEDNPKINNNNNNNSKETKQSNEEYSNEEEDASEPEENIDKHEEGTFESPSQKFPLKSDISNEKEERKNHLFQDAEEYTPREPPNFYLINLPIENKQFHGPFMNSYGQSLEHEGKIDDNIADYFQNYKNGQFRIFDASSITPVIRQRPWWIDETQRNSIIKATSEYNSLPQKRYEEYELSDSRNEKNQEIKQASANNKNQVASIERNANKKNRVEKERSSENYKKGKSTESIIEIENKRDSEVPLELSPLQTFDFIKYSPYSAPVQYLFPPESLERSAQLIITRHNLEKHKNSDKQIVPEEMEEKLNESKEIKAWLVPFYVINPNNPESIDHSESSADTLRSEYHVPTEEYSERENIKNTDHLNSEDSSIIQDRRPQLTDQIASKEAHNSNNFTKQEYTSERSEPIDDLHVSIYKNPGVYSEPRYVNHYPQSTVDSLSSQYSNEYPEESSPSTYQIKQIKVPITTYNPITYKFSPTISNSYVDNITQRNQAVSSLYPADNSKNEEPISGKQSQYLTSLAKTLTINSDKPKIITPINDYIFGQRINQPQDHQKQSSNINNHNYAIYNNPRMSISQSKRIVNLSRNAKKSF